MEWSSDLSLYPIYLRNRLKKGRGLGVAASYQPWIKIYDFPSEGTSSRIKNVQAIPFSKQMEFVMDESLSCRAVGMIELVREGFNRLSGGEGGRPVFRLKQAMGGGKTHLIRTMAFLARHPGLRLEFFPEANARYAFSGARVCFFNGREQPDDYFWGRIAAQLGHAGIFESGVKSPGENHWNALFDKVTDPVLILFDETSAEIDYLEIIRQELSRPDAVDPKLNAAKWFLQHHKSQDKTWCDLGCIIFSQYFDTAKWIAGELTKDYPEHIVAVYAGAGKSGLYKDGRFVSVEREIIKKMVKTRDVTLVVATDAACEGLNLQTLGTLINIDLPWNPSRLEQRLGRIKRFGQTRKTVDMLNLVYHDTRDEDVYRKISERMKDRFDIFGGVPDCVDDDWIDRVEEFEELARTHLHMRDMTTNIFEEKWGRSVMSAENRWDECTRVLSRRDIDKAMSRPWATK